MTALDDAALAALKAAAEQTVREWGPDARMVGVTAGEIRALIARAERLAAVLEAEREERRAERAVWEAGDALERAEARDDELAYAQAVKQHDAALQAYDLVHERAEAARAALAAERGEAQGGAA